MEDNDDIPKFKFTLSLAAEALSKKPENEIRQQGGESFIKKYYKPRRSLVSRIFGLNKTN